ncbi:HlyC/CorC family transporter [Thiolapillus brandeum]|uniref:Magnesium and cobalt efflux protein CorC n=1 Tax=Thiolapillus brandeum TaxID=1076588 RepID=A0A7U6GLL8_9GAMM|nr:transporter associated domain-containing protein [Thiolapillus brandeum]BAO45749.1 magnesium / cobalt transporter [Thiolapillus brandeum]
MNDSGNSDSRLRKGLRGLLAPLLKHGPENREELVGVLKQARARHLMDGEALSMMEAVLEVSELRVRDIMIPRARMVVVERDKAMEAILPVIVDSAHSRFPVIGDDRSEVVGILLAKDLLQYCGPRAPSFNMRDVLRSAVFVPESKRLNVLLKEFRLSRNHMAIVIDEYGGAAGLITIEDVLEQIVGEIEDEYDFDEGAYILKRGEGLYTAKAHTTIEDFNEFFHTAFGDDDYDTIGGMVVNALGHMPGRGESVSIGDFRFTVVRADSRKVRLLNIERLDQKEDTANKGEKV